MSIRHSNGRCSSSGSAIPRSAGTTLAAILLIGQLIPAHLGAQWLQNGATFKASETIGRDVRHGRALAMSADGSVIVAGGYNSAWGATWVYAREGGIWVEHRLSGSGESVYSALGWSVAVSRDGSRIAIGGPASNRSAGAVWMYTRDETTWREEARLDGEAGLDESQMGTAVSLSGDGTLLAVGGTRCSSGRGAVWMYERENGLWKRKGMLTVAGCPPGTQFGSALTLSDDGRALAIGACREAGGAGSVWMFARCGNDWIPEARLTVDDASGAPLLGRSLALSADGQTLVAGGPCDADGIGAAWVFVRRRGEWRQFGPKLAGTRPLEGQSHQGTSVALSSDGRTAIVAGYDHEKMAGVLWTFVRVNTLWVETDRMTVGSITANKSMGAISAVLSGDGQKLAVGLEGAANGRGGIWSFDRIQRGVADVAQFMLRQ